MRAKKTRRGFTLLEVLVATAILGVAIAALLGGMATSLRNQVRVTSYENAVLAARQRMEALLVEKRLPRFVPIEGTFAPDATGRTWGGWRARVTPFQTTAFVGPGAEVLDRIELEAWWGADGERRTFSLSGYRRGVLEQADFADGTLRR